MKNAPICKPRATFKTEKGATNSQAQIDADLADDAAEEEPDAAAHAGHAGGDHGEGYDAIVLIFHKTNMSAQVRCWKKSAKT